MIQLTITNTAGTFYGVGPISTALNVEYTAVLDGAGEWSLNVPAGDPRVADIALDRIIIANLLTKSGTRTLFRGPIRDIKYAVSNGEQVYNIRGEDELGLLREVLVWDTLEQVSWEIPQRVERQSGLSTLDLANLYDGDAGTFYDLKWSNLASEYFVYVQFYAQINGLRFDVGTLPNQATADLTVQYFDGIGWENVSGLTDGTAVGGVTMAQDGDVVWTRPEDEVEAHHNTILAYWVRMHVNNDLDSDTGTGGQQDVRLNEISVRYVGPKTDEIADLLTDHAPSGWATNATYYPGTATGVLDVYEGETLLEVLVRIARQAGEHFRMSATSKRVDWLRSQTYSNGLTAVASNHHNANNSNTCIIESIDAQSNSDDRVTRVYAFAAGGVGAATDLSEAGGITYPSGYSLETDAGGRYYIKNSTLETSIGRAITRRLDMPDIVPLYGTGQNKKTSEALGKATLAYMQKRATSQTVYRVRLSHTAGQILPGDKIRVVYHGVTSNGTQVLNLNQELVVLRVTSQVDKNGLKTDLLLSDVARLPASDETILAEIIQEMRAQKKRPQPIKGRQISGLQSGRPA